MIKPLLLLHRGKLWFSKRERAQFFGGTPFRAKNFNGVVGKLRLGRFK